MVPTPQYSLAISYFTMKQAYEISPSPRDGGTEGEKTG